MKNPLTYKVNTYFAVLLVTIIGSWASLTIIRVAYAHTFDASTGYNDASYNQVKTTFKKSHPLLPN